MLPPKLPWFMKSWWILYFRAEIVHSLDDFCSIKLLFLLYPGMCPLWGCVSWLVVYSFAPLDLPLPQVTVLYNLAHVTECSAGGGQVCNCQAFLPDIFACHCIMNRGGVEISLNFRWGVHSKQSHLDDVIWPDAPLPHLTSSDHPTPRHELHLHVNVWCFGPQLLTI